MKEPAPEPLFEFREGAHYLGFWFIGGEDTDWFGVAWRDAGSDHWTFHARFRYHDPASVDPFDGKDQKSPMAFHIDASKKSEDDIIRDIGLIAALIGQRLKVEPQFVAVRGNRDKLLYQLALQPWAHVQMGAAAKPREPVSNTRQP
jgi:hypothetical protein